MNNASLIKITLSIYYVYDNVLIVNIYFILNNIEHDLFRVYNIIT